MPPLAAGLKAKLAAGLRARQLEHKKLHEQTNKKKQNKPTNTHRQNKQKQEKKTSKKSPTPLPSSQNLKICIVQMRGVSLSDTATNTEETLKKCLAIHKKLPQNQAEGKKYLKRMHKKTHHFHFVICVCTFLPSSAKGYAPSCASPIRLPKEITATGSSLHCSSIPFISKPLGMQSAHPHSKPCGLQASEPSNLLSLPG